MHVQVCVKKEQALCFGMQRKYDFGFVVIFARGKLFIFQPAFMGKICVEIVIYSKGWPELQLCENEINVRPSYSFSQVLYNDRALIELTKVL